MSERDRSGDSATPEELEALRGLMLAYGTPVCLARDCNWPMVIVAEPTSGEPHTLRHPFWQCLAHDDHRFGVGARDLEELRRYLCLSPRARLAWEAARREEWA